MVSQLPLKQLIGGSNPSACAFRSVKFEDRGLKFHTSNFSLQTSHGGRPVLVQELGCEPSLYRFNSVRSPLKKAKDLRL